jgi:hypothetical protein
MSVFNKLLCNEYKFLCLFTKKKRKKKKEETKRKEFDAKFYDFSGRIIIL